MTTPFDDLAEARQAGEQLPSSKDEKKTTQLRLTSNCIKLYCACGNGNRGLRATILDWNRRTACAGRFRVRWNHCVSRGQQSESTVPLCAKQTPVADTGNHCKHDRTLLLATRSHSIGPCIKSESGPGHRTVRDEGGRPCIPLQTGQKLPNGLEH